MIIRERDPMKGAQGRARRGEGVWESGVYTAKYMSIFQTPLTKYRAA